MKLIRLLIAFSIWALLLTGCSTRTGNTSEVAQHSQSTNTSSATSNEARYQPLPKDFDQEKYNVTGNFDLEVMKVRRQVDNGIYQPKQSVYFTIAGYSQWDIQKIIASDYCIEVHAVCCDGFDKGRRGTWYLYENARWFGTPQKVVSLFGYEVDEFSINRLISAREGEKEFMVLAAAHKVFNQYGAKYSDTVEPHMIIR